MVFKINIGTKDGKTFKLESEAGTLIGKKLGDKIKGKDIFPDLEGYEFEIKGTSDKAGFTSMENVEGIGLKKVLLTYGKAMKKRPKKEGKKKQLCKKPKGLRLRRTVRGNVISEKISQINLKISKEGVKKLTEIFPEQIKDSHSSAEDVKQEQDKTAEDAESRDNKPVETPKEDKPEEKPVEEKKE